MAERVALPPIHHAGFLINCLANAGFSQRGFSGLDPISPETLEAWSRGTSTPLGAIDFQDILDGSRAYVAAYEEFDGKACFAPWEPNLTKEQTADLIAAQHRMMDAAMAG